MIKVSFSERRLILDYTSYFENGRVNQSCLVITKGKTG